MKLVVHGPAAGYGPDGNIHSWSPDQAVDIDDGDDKAVAWAHARADTDLFDIVEDAPVKPTPEPTLAELQAAAKAAGLPSYGTKAELTERLAQQEE